MSKKRQKTADIITCYSSKDDQILIIFRTSINDATSHQMTIQFATSPNVSLCTSSKNHNKWNMHWNKQKKNINKIHLSRSVAPDSPNLSLFA